MAFNAKNLTYDKSEPAFLQRLKAGYAAQDGRSNIQHARSGKSRLKMGDGDEDDGPVILDESGQVIEKGVYEGMMSGEKIESKQEKKMVENVATKSDEQDQLGAVNLDGASKNEKQTEASIGAVRKRKAVKAVGVADEEGEDTGPSPSIKHAVGKEDDAEQKTVKKAAPEKSKKKSKKIKLSFDEPE